MIQKLTHAPLVASDQEKALKFYSRLDEQIERMKKEVKR